MNQKTENETSQILHVCAKVLIRCFAFSVLILMIWFVWLLTCGDFGYQYFSAWFGLTKQEFVLENLNGMTELKLLSVTLFLVPYAAIKLVLHNMYKNTASDN
ncbi:MAG: hypothetical protein HOJ48_14410 [Desulfobacula sp.]|nr:hypothetical protein [Desulfobacula sp.]